MELPYAALGDFLYSVTGERFKLLPLRGVGSLIRNTSNQTGDGMKRSLLFLLTAGVLSLTAWCFWHFLGRAAMDVLTASIMVLLAVDNDRLRRALAKAAKG